MSEKIKVTECWTKTCDDESPNAYTVYGIQTSNDRPAVLLWREDYEALIKERDELRKRCRYNLDPGAQITCWDEYESLRARHDAMRKELDLNVEAIHGLQEQCSQLRDKYAAAMKELEELRGANTNSEPWIKCEHGEYRRIGNKVEFRCPARPNTEEHEDISKP